MTDHSIETLSTGATMTDDTEPQKDSSKRPTYSFNNVSQTLHRCCQLFLAFLLLISLRQYCFPLDDSNLIVSSSSSLRIQANPNQDHPRRRLQTYNPNNAIHQFDIMVPVFERDDNLRQFAARLKPALEDYKQLTAQNKTRITTFRLLMTRYQKEQATSSTLQKELSQITGFPLDQIVMVHAPNVTTSFDRAHAVNLMLQQAACTEPYCLVSRMDVDMQVLPSFFLNSERDVISGQTAYFPIVWSAFHPKSPDLAQFLLDVKAMRENTARYQMGEYSEHRGHWREYGTGMWTIGGPDAASFRFNEDFKGWGGEDGDFYERVKGQRKIVRYREPGLVHLWHVKMCTRGVTVFTETQINECNWSRDGEKGTVLVQGLVDKWITQHQPEPAKESKPIWQA